MGDYLSNTAQSSGAARDWPSVALDRERLFSFLCSSPVVPEDGAVPSWWNPRKPGYPYPEAAALWLSWAAWRKTRGESAPGDHMLRRVVTWLAGKLASAGAIGKGGRLFLFDTCLAAHGLARISTHLPEAQAPARIALDGVARFLEADLPVLPAAISPARWSYRWHLHHERGAALLRQAGLLLDEPRANRMADSLRARIDERVIRPEYLHATLYGVEGALLHRVFGLPQGPLNPAKEAERLAALQTPEGALPAFVGRDSGERCDTTAQAVRLWCVVDRARYDTAIANALMFLATRQHPEGGVDYGPRDGDRTVWVAIFTDQAAAWAHGGAEPEEWL